MEGQAGQVGLHFFQLAGGFVALGLVFGNACGFLEKLAALFGGGAEHGLHLALVDNGVAVGAYAGVQEHLADIPQAALHFVDKILGLFRAVDLAGDGDFAEVQRQLA
ncbi:MAG: hypothetical protein NTY45_13455 [Elusimicrobia bacterium]|nr:hypothetical protein [Elusimicrobiota bacterium]